MTQKPNTDGSVDHVRVLMEEFTRSGIATLHVRLGEFELLLSTDANAPSLLGGGSSVHTLSAPASAVQSRPAAATVAAPVKAVPAVKSTASSIPDGAVVIAAPNLGTFYRAPKPGADPYVEIGGRVTVGDDICLIEVMKLFTAVKAEQAGKIVAILVEDGAMVEAGQPLFAMVAD